MRIEIEPADANVLHPAGNGQKVSPPEAFGSGRTTPPGYEAFGKGEPAQLKPNDKKLSKNPSHQPAAPDQHLDEKDDPSTGDENDPEAEAAQDDNEPKKPNRPKLYRRPAVIIGSIIVIALLILAAIGFWLWYRQFESTDDAYIDAHVTEISAQVAAPIKQLHVSDNELVHPGDLLVELDPTDYQVALNQAQAQAQAASGRVEQAKAQIATAQATVTQYGAEIESAQIMLENATRDLQRYQNVDERARSQQQLDNATAARKNAEAQLAQARAHQASAVAGVSSAEAAVKGAEGDLQQANANVERARVNLSYCRIIAPSEGRVTQRTAENGNYVTPGQTLFNLVSPTVWVTANFKETQLRNMKPGQAVTIKVDAYPDKKFQGAVDSIQAGSGARFSVLPAENATGNFVKIVQRVPVKILIDQGANTDDYRLLSPGLSVVPRVRVR